MNPIHMIIPEKEIKPSKCVGVSERFGWIIGGYFGICARATMGSED